MKNRTMGNNKKHKKIFTTKSCRKSCHMIIVRTPNADDAVCMYIGNRQIIFKKKV